MRILQISKYYYPFIGGVEQVARDCALALEGHEQRIFCFNHEKGDKTDCVDGVEVCRAGCFAKISSQSLSLSYGKRLKEQFGSFCPELVIFHYPNPFGAHYLLKCLKKYPQTKLVVWWHLDITKQKFLKKFFKGQTNRLLTRADRIVATSPDYLEGSEFLPAYREKCRVIPNCVNPARIGTDGEVERRAQAIREQYAGKTILFAIGRHVPYKGMEYLVRASKLLDDGFAVVIGGSGPLTPSLKELAEGDQKVVFTGRLSDLECKAYFSACDIFCFPSVTKNEAFGIALAEGMSYGKPAVTFAIEGSGVRYVCPDGVTGIEAENANAGEYASAILRLRADGALRYAYGRAAAERVQSMFTFDIFKKNLCGLIGETEKEA